MTNARKNHAEPLKPSKTRQDVRSEEIKFFLKQLSKSEKLKEEDEEDNLHQMRDKDKDALSTSREAKV